MLNGARTKSMNATCYLQLSVTPSHAQRESKKLSGRLLIIFGRLYIYVSYQPQQPGRVQNNECLHTPNSTVPPSSFMAQLATVPLVHRCCIALLLSVT